MSPKKTPKTTDFPPAAAGAKSTEEEDDAEDPDHTGGDGGRGHRGRARHLNLPALPSDQQMWLQWEVCALAIMVCAEGGDDVVEACDEANQATRTMLCIAFDETARHFSKLLYAALISLIAASTSTRTQGLVQSVLTKKSLRGDGVEVWRQLKQEFVSHEREQRAREHRELLSMRPLTKQPADVGVAIARYRRLVSDLGIADELACHTFLQMLEGVTYLTLAIALLRDRHKVADIDMTFEVLHKSVHEALTEYAGKEGRPQAHLVQTGTSGAADTTFRTKDPKQRKQGGAALPARLAGLTLQDALELSWTDRKLLCESLDRKTRDAPSRAPHGGADKPQPKKRAVPTGADQPICRDFQSGHCRRGARCRFQHVQGQPQQRPQHSQHPPQQHQQLQYTQHPQQQYAQYQQGGQCAPSGPGPTQQLASLPPLRDPQHWTQQSNTMVSNTPSSAGGGLDRSEVMQMIRAEQYARERPPFQLFTQNPLLYTEVQRSGSGIEWVLDTGASLHVARKDSCVEAPTETMQMDTTAGLVTMQVGMAHTPFGVCKALCGNHNILSVAQLTQDGRGELRWDGPNGCSFRFDGRDFEVRVAAGVPRITVGGAVPSNFLTLAEQHELLHLPLNPDCLVCAMSRGAQYRHRRVDPSSETRATRSTEPLELLHVDCLYVGKRPNTAVVMIARDDFTKALWLSVAPVPHARMTVQLMERILSEVPRRRIQRLRTDQGTEFVNADVQQFCTTHGIRHSQSVAAESQTNAVIERTVQVVRSLMSRSSLQAFGQRAEGLSLLFESRVAPYVASAVERLHNLVHKTENGSTPAARLGIAGYAHAPLLPFGLEVVYTELGLGEQPGTKLAQRGSLGIFLGYDTKSLPATCIVLSKESQILTTLNVRRVGEARFPLREVTREVMERVFGSPHVAPQQGAQHTSHTGGGRCQACRLPHLDCEAECLACRQRAQGKKASRAHVADSRCLRHRCRCSFPLFGHEEPAQPPTPPPTPPPRRPEQQPYPRDTSVSPGPVVKLQQQDLGADVHLDYADDSDDDDANPVDLSVTMEELFEELDWGSVASESGHPDIPQPDVPRPRAAPQAAAAQPHAPPLAPPHAHAAAPTGPPPAARVMPPAPVWSHRGPAPQGGAQHLTVDMQPTHANLQLFKDEVNSELSKQISKYGCYQREHSRGGKLLWYSDEDLLALQHEGMDNILTVPARLHLATQGLQSASARRKARIIVQGDRLKRLGSKAPLTTQSTPVWSNPVDLPTLRLLSGVGRACGLTQASLDIEAAYLQAPLGSEVIFVRPDGALRSAMLAFDKERGLPPNGGYLRLLRPVYGLPHSGHLFEGHRDASFHEAGWDKLGPSLYGQPGSLCASYVDDLYTVTPQHPATVKVPMTEHSKAGWAVGAFPYLGMEVDAIAGELSIDRTTAAVLKTHKAELIAPVDGVPSKKQLKPTDACVPLNSVRSLLGSLLWLTRTSRPDLARPVSELASADDIKVQAQLGYRILGYLRAHPECAVSMLPLNIQCSHMQIRVAVDASFASEARHRSRTGMNVYLDTYLGAKLTGTQLIDWSSRVQTCVASSTQEAELCGIAAGARTGTALLDTLIRMLAYVAPHITTSLVVENDNAPAIAAIRKGSADSLGHLTRMSCIRLDALTELFGAGHTIGLRHVGTHSLCADVHTKSLAPVPTVGHFGRMGLTFRR